MIRPAQRKLLDRAREAKALDAADFAELLRRCGGADSIEALTARGFDRLMDHFTVSSFRCRERPILSLATRKLIEEAARLLDLSDHTYAADLRGHAGVSDLRDMTGNGLIDLLSRWEHRGLKVATFTAKRRTITQAQLRLIQVARKQNAMEDRRYYGMLQWFGGVVSAADLDGRGFDLCMAFLGAEGFHREPLATAAPGFGRRAGFASPEQVELIRSLWREWFGPTPEADAVVEAALNAWLEKYHRASSLRFLTTASAGKAIAALRTMKSRTTQRAGLRT